MAKSTATVIQLVRGYQLLVDADGKQYKLPREFLTDMDVRNKAIGGDDRRFNITVPRFFHIYETQPGIERTWTFGTLPPGNGWIGVDSDKDGNICWERTLGVGK